MKTLQFQIPPPRCFVVCAQFHRNGPGDGFTGNRNRD